MDDDTPRKKRQAAGLPAWMATFADLMALLLCFFVLLLSFSEMDAMKFKRLAGSLAQAFGVQTELQVNEVPKGPSIIAQEVSRAGIRRLGARAVEAAAGGTDPGNRAGCHGPGGASAAADHLRAD